MADDRDAEFVSNKQDFAYFLEPENAESMYAEKVQDMVESGEKRLVVDLSHINRYDPSLRRNVLERPLQFLPAWEEALKDYVEHNQLGKAQKRWRIAVSGGFGAHRVTPQELQARHVGQLVCVEGIVSKVSAVRPKVMETVHYCEQTKEYHRQAYRDATSMVGLPTGSTYPTTDASGNPLTTEFGLCTYINHQKVFIQDMPERTAAGSMPQTIECVLEDDIVDACKPGDRVQMIGVYRALAGRVAGASNGRFRTVLLINNVRKIGTDDHSRSMSVDEVRKIKRLSKEKDIFSVLARSISPSIHGHEHIKKAIVLQLLGGVEKNLDNGTHIRGDINILMVGDPSCGKSQMLRAVMNIAPLAINTTGRGSSGVGLTAAVTQDKDSGERRLEAGAMVLADRGVVCIDEFDKMSDNDRTAIHEVMEQQTVTVAKAGIHTSLNARCSVIAAANPIYGQYDRRLEPHRNIGLPDSLLSRFDLLFIVLDKIDSDIDRNISTHVLNMHGTPHVEQLESMFDELEMDEDEEQDVEVWEKKVVTVGGSKRRRKKDRYFTVAFCKKYIEFAKKQYKPLLTDDACKLIASTYADLRRAEHTQTLPITARCLETVIRLSTAHAKLRLSKKVEERDVEEAVNLLKFALTNDAEPAPRNVAWDEMAHSVEVEEEEEESRDASGTRRGRGKGRKHRGKTLEDSEDEKKDEEKESSSERGTRTRKRLRPDSQDGDHQMVDSPAIRKPKRKRPNIDRKNVQTVTSTLSGIFKNTRSDQTTVEALKEALDAEGHAIADGDLERILEHLNNTNKIFKMGEELHSV